MALKTGEERKSDTTNCPRCGSVAVLIPAKTVEWLNCTNPKCKFKKLMPHEEAGIKVTGLID